MGSAPVANPLLPSCPGSVRGAVTDSPGTPREPIRCQAGRVIASSFMSERLEDILSEFADRIRAAVREEMLAALGATIGAPKPAKGLNFRAPSTAARGRRKKGQKRDSKELAGITARLLGAIKAGKGMRIEEISKALKISTKDLALPAKKLIAEGKIRTTGTRRATRYFEK